MKQFSKECEHAQRERENKWLYSEEEIADGCWLCGGPLAPLEVNSPILGERKRWQCIPCTKRHIEEAEKQIDLGECATLGELKSSMAEARAKLIAEVEACGPDCPWYERIKWWRA